MSKIQIFKDFLMNDKIHNMNVTYSELQKAIDDIVGDAATFNVVATPVAAPVAGSVLIGSTVALTCATVDSIIYYTIDGSAADDTKLVYTGPITITGAETIKAKAYKGYRTASAGLSAAYTITLAATPIATPGAGEVADNTEVALTCATAGSTIYYTINGVTPTDASTEYTGVIVITDAITLKAIAYATNYAASAVLTAAYTIAV